MQLDPSSGMTEQRYFVTGMQRSGTSVIHHGLRGHPQISAFKHEVGFDRFFGQGASYFCWGRELAESERREAPSALFDALAGLGASEETRAAGIKCLMFDPSQARRFVDILNNRLTDCHLIRVRRSDPVAQFGSLVKAQQTGVWQQRGNSLIKAHDYSDLRRLDESNKGDVNIKVDLDRYKLLDYILLSYSINLELDKVNDSRVHNINYEDDIHRKDFPDNSTFGLLYDFLDVASVSPHWIETKKLSPPAEEYISNYHGLRQFAREIRDQLATGMSPQALREKYRPPMTRRVADSIRWHLNHPLLAIRKIRDRYF